jgi:hypothetical protein
MKKTLAAVIVGFVMIVLAAVPMVAGAPATGTGSSSGLTPEEAAIIKGIDFDNAWNQLDYLGTLGEKSAGTDAETSAQQYVFDQFSAMAVDDVWWETFPVEKWDHFGTTVKILSNGDEDVLATTYGNAPSIYGTNDNKP